MAERHELTPEDRQLLQFLRTLTDRRLLLIIAMAVLKDSRIRETVVQEVSTQ